VPDRQGAWRDILCMVEKRVVGHRQHGGPGRRRLQLPKGLRSATDIASMPAAPLFPTTRA